MPICIPFHWLVVSTSPNLHRTQTKGGDGKYRKAEAKRNKEWGLLWGQPAPCLGSVCLRKDLSAWANQPITWICCDETRTKERKLPWHLHFPPCTSIQYSFPSHILVIHPLTPTHTIFTYLRGRISPGDCSSDNNTAFSHRQPHGGNGLHQRIISNWSKHVGKGCGEPLSDPLQPPW